MNSSIHWPHGAQCAVMLTFDCDYETCYLNWGPEYADRPVALSAGRYGAEAATPEILEMLADNQLRGTFFFPGWCAEHHPHTVQAVLGGGHEIGAHGYLHEYLENRSLAEEEEILAKTVGAIKGATGQPPLGYRAPAWEITPHTLGLLEKYGFVYSSNFMDSIHPYLHHRPDGSTSLVELPVYWDIDDAPFITFARGRPMPHGSIDLIEAMWRREFDAYYRRGGLFNLTCHPHFERPAHVDMLRRFVGYLRGFPNVWFATGLEVSAHVKELSSVPQ